MKVDYFKPNLPDIDIYHSFLKEIWNIRQLTNNGKNVRLLEEKLSEYLGVEEVILVSNGTIGLQIAIQALELNGNILTTPFSFIASTSSLLWEKCTPVYSDIDIDTLLMDLSLVQNNNYEGMLPVQIFGLPINENSLQKDVPVIIDGAQSFGVFKDGKSILNQGDVSMVSFHATKFFHTVEGGAIVTNNKSLAKRIRSIRNFGCNENQTNIDYIGINAKMSEFHAAMGLALFDRIDLFKEKNKIIYNHYYKIISGKTEICYLPEREDNLDYHYAYFPIIFKTKELLESFIEYLNKNEIGYKRYFNLPLNKLPFIEYHSCPVCESICDRIVSIPVYFEMKEEEIEYVCNVLQMFFSE